MGDGERNNRCAAHAAAPEMRACNVQMLEQPFALRDVMPPGDRLDPSARLAAFASVEQDAAKMRRQMIEQLYLLVDAECRPGFGHRIEAARRVHQERRGPSRSLHNASRCRR
jgi:hypothetical protein